MLTPHALRAEFYSYPDWWIAQVCAVHIQTARHWKAGVREPGKTALKLWRLHRDGKILGDEWAGFAVRGGNLVDPEGHETSQAQLRAWPFVWQLAAENARLNPGANEFFQQLLARLDTSSSSASGVHKRKRAAPTAAIDAGGGTRLPRIGPDPSTLPTVILPRSTRRKRA